MPDSDDDPWGFIAPKKRDVPTANDPEAAPEALTPAAEPTTGPSDEPSDGLDDLAAIGKASVRSHRERGELRAEMGGPSLRRRAWPLALALGLLVFAGYLTEIVASSQMLAIVGPTAPLYIFPLGGLGLIIIALVQFRFIDHRARLPMIRAVAGAYALAFAIATTLLLNSVVPAISIGFVWILADQLNFLMPLLLWSLASDEFNVAESRKIYPWVVTWAYGGQVLGLAVAAVSPWILTSLDIPMGWLLVLPPVICAFIAFWLPRALRDSHAAKGSDQHVTTGESLASAREFIAGVPVWRHFLIAAILTFISGLTLYLMFLVEAEDVVGADAARLQTILGFAALIWFLLCWAIQSWGAERLQNRIGIPGVLLLLPIAAIAAGVIMTIGSFTATLAILIVGVSLWVIPRYSIDENARRSALAFVPDERRARVSFVVDLLPVALGLIVSGPLALIGALTGKYWIVAIACIIIAAIALIPSLAVRRQWEDSLLNWRLRRRKQNRTLEL